MKQKLSDSAQPIIVLFDGVCNLCNGAVQFIIKRDPQARFKFASLQSDAAREVLQARGLNPDELYSIIVIDDSQVMQRSDAVLKIAQHLRGFWRSFTVFKILPKFLRDGLYNLIARSRYSVFGKRDECMIPSPELKSRFL